VKWKRLEIQIIISVLGGLDFEYCSPLTGCCEHSNETSCSIGFNFSASVWNRAVGLLVYV
jgi:hypothetical protein